MSTDHQEFPAEKLGISPSNNDQGTRRNFHKGHLLACFCGDFLWLCRWTNSFGVPKKWGCCTQDLTKEHCPKPTQNCIRELKHWQLKNDDLRECEPNLAINKYHIRAILGLEREVSETPTSNSQKTAQLRKVPKKCICLRNLDQELFRISSEFRDHLRRFRMMNWLNESIMNHLRTSSTCVANKIPSTLPFFSLRLRLKTTLLIHDTTISLWRLKIDSNHEKNLYQQP